MNLDLQQLKAAYIAALENERNAVTALGHASAKFEAEILALTEKFQQENAKIIEAEKAAIAACEESEKALREFAVNLYAETGEKQLDENVSIRVNKRLEYDAAQAFNWSKERGICLTLDKKAFEKVALSLGAPVTEVETAVAVLKGLA